MIGLLIFTLVMSSVFVSQRFTVINHEGKSCKIADKNFALSWIHSVDKTPWVEQYQRMENGFNLTYSIFKTFGAGVPHDGRVLQSHNGMIHYEMNLPMAEINWVIDQDVHSTIILPNNQHWEIYQYSPRYSEVQIRNQSLNFWQRLLIRNCHES